MFARFGVRSMLEFGLGGATEQFIRELDHVTSVEIYTSDKELEEKLKISGPQWAKKFGEELASPKWNIVMVEAGDGIIAAEKDVTGKASVPRGSDPTSDKYKKELADIIDSIDWSGYDYAFVDAGIHLRGDLVNALFGKVRIIGAHDTNDRDVSGYKRVVCPPEYRVEEHSQGCGTTFWIQKNI